LSLLAERISEEGLATGRRFFAISAGDKHSEQWRSDFASKLEMPIQSRIVNCYGSSDAGLMAFETPLSIDIRRRISTSESLQKLLFGVGAEVVPAIFQFDPALIFFEEINDELIVTLDGDLPLIRYNMHDLGRVLEFGEMLCIVNTADRSLAKHWQLPFLVLKGRVDVAVIFFGLKIFPGDIEAAWKDELVAHYCKRSFSTYMYMAPDCAMEHLVVELELNDGIKEVPLSEDSMMVDRFQDALKRENIEYRGHCKNMGNALSRPRLVYRHSGRRMPLPTSKEGRVSSAFCFEVGEKPRMLF
jgi:phenylacetate-CoA ligase